MEAHKFSVGDQVRLHLDGSADHPADVYTTSRALPAMANVWQGRVKWLGDAQERAVNEQQPTKVASQTSAQRSFADLQQDIKSTSDSIHYAGANCVANCAQWNDLQQQKQQEVDTMKAQLGEAQKQLEEMQAAARKEGFGRSVYDP